MERTNLKVIEKFEHRGIQYRRIKESSKEPSWEFYNTGYGEHGWLQVRGNSAAASGVIQPETLEAIYQRNFR